MLVPATLHTTITGAAMTPNCLAAPNPQHGVNMIKAFTIITLLGISVTPALAWDAPCAIGKPCVLAIRQPPLQGEQDRRNFFWGTTLAVENGFVQLTNASFLALATPADWGMDQAIAGLTPPGLHRLAPSDKINLHITDNVIWSSVAKKLP